MSHKILVIMMLFLVLVVTNPGEPVNASVGSTPITTQTAGYIPNYLFQDDFNSGSASQWTPFGPGTWSVQSGEYVVDMGSGQNLFGGSYAGESQWTDYIIEFDLKGESGVDKAFEVRFDDATHQGYLFVFRSNYSVLFGDVLLFHMLHDPSLGSNWGNLVQQATYPNSLHTWYHMMVAVIGPHLQLFIDHQPVLNYTFSAPYLTHGKIAFWGWTGAMGSDVVYFDNVKVATPATLYLPMVVR